MSAKALPLAGPKGDLAVVVAASLENPAVVTYTAGPELARGKAHVAQVNPTVAPVVKADFAEVADVPSHAVVDSLSFQHRQHCWELVRELPRATQRRHLPLLLRYPQIHHRDNHREMRGFGKF